MKPAATDRSATTVATVKRVYVTGGSGFLGSSVVSGLAAFTDEVELVVSADVRPPSSLLPNVRYERVDVTDAAAVDEQLRRHRIDTVVHLAAIVNSGKMIPRDRSYAVDVTGTRTVLDACRANRVTRIVVSSSGAAYGYHADNPPWIDEQTPLRGNPEFVYADHKRLVEEMLAAEQISNPGLEQVILRIGTILGESVDNQITALLRRKRLLAIRGSASPFVFVWDDDVVAVMIRAVLGGPTGAFNVAGDGALTIDQIAAALGKPMLTLPEPVLRAALAVGHRLGLTRYGPEQTVFLQYRPVLDNTKLKQVFGYTPTRSSAQAFDAWRTHGRHH